MEGLYAGLDVSTQSCKLVIIDLKSNKVVFVGAVNYDKNLPKYGTKHGVRQNQPEGVSESDPNMWIEAVDGVFQKAKSAGIAMDQIRCISVSGQQHGLVSIDAEGNLTRPTSKLWNDFSTLEECDILTKKVGGLDAMVAEVGNSQRTGYTAAKIFHMVRHEPENYAKTTTLFLVHNYINFYLTGGVRVMEPGDTSGMALWNPKTGKWSEKVMAAIGPDLKKKIPPLKPSDESIGTISQDLIRRFGFSPDCKIDAGTGDNMYGAVGTGNVEPGIVTISLGTSGTAYSYMETPYVDPTGEIAAFCDSTGHYLPLLCVSNLANGYNDIIKLHNLSFDDFDRFVEDSKPGNEGRLLIPWYMGERTPDVPKAAPVYFGFDLGDFTKEILCRAVIEGHILNLYDGFKRMPIKPKEIRLTGGISKSDVWGQTIADIFEAETVPVEGEGAALGAALHAAWVWLKESGQNVTLKDVVSPFVVLDETRRRKPIPENVAVYQKQKKYFSALSARVRGKSGEDPFALRMQLV
jgi:xylulokinase